MWYLASRSQGCYFTCTKFVEYEALYKQRTRDSEKQRALRDALRNEVRAGQFKAHALDIADLQEVEALEARKKLGMGELSSIVFAKKIGQAVLIDDLKGRTLAEGYLSPSSRAQTTCYLLGWLYFNGVLSKNDTARVISEHVKNEGDLEPHLVKACVITDEYLRRAGVSPEQG